MKKVAFERLHIKLPLKAPSYFYFSHLIKTQISLLWIAPTEIGRHLCRSHSVYYLFGLTVEHKSRSAELLSGFLHPNQSTQHNKTSDLKFHSSTRNIYQEEGHKETGTIQYPYNKLQCR